MTRSIIGVVILALTASSVSAQLGLPQELSKVKSALPQVPSQLPLVQSPRETLTTLSLTGRNSWDWLGEPVNDRASVDLGSLLGAPGSAARVTGIGWDTTLSTVGISWACEAVMDFAGQVWLTVGFEDCAPVTSTPYSSNGIVNLVDLDLDFVVGDGVLGLEWFETFDDFPGAIDAMFESGELTIEFEAFTIPDPPTAIDLGVIANAGERVVLDTVGSQFDTMLGLYDGDGNLLMVNDDFGVGLASLLLLHDAPEGTYYVGLGAYFTEFRPYWDARTGSSFSNGDYVLNYTATDSITGFLQPQSVEWFKFEVVPEPSSVLLLMGGGLALLFRRRLSPVIG